MRETKLVLSKEDIKLLIIAREVAKNYHEQLRRTKQSLTIKRIKQSPYIVNVSSAEAYITRALYSSDKPLHFSQIVEKIVELGWKSNSSYHKFAYIEKVLRENYFMFKRVAPATFTLRDAFKEQITSPSITKRNLSSRPIPTSQDVIRTIANKYRPTSIYELFKMMSFIGYRFSYGTIKRYVLKDDVLHLGSEISQNQ